MKICFHNKIKKRCSESVQNFQQCSDSSEYLAQLMLIENGGVTHNFESGPPKDHFNSNF